MNKEIKCKIAEHIPSDDGETCLCGYFKKSNWSIERIKHSRDTASNFMNFKKDIIQIVLEDVPHYAQKRLLDILDVKKNSNWEKNITTNLTKQPMNLKEQLEEFDEKFLKQKICKCCLLEDCDYSTTGCPWYVDELILNSDGGNVDTATQIKQWHINSLISLAKGEVDRLKEKKIPQGMIDYWDETNSRDDAVQKGEIIGYNRCLDDSISHWEKTLSILEGK